MSLFSSAPKTNNFFKLAFTNKDTLQDIILYEQEKHSIQQEIIFADLSCDIWNIIFSYLDTEIFAFRFVCSTWNAMIICNPIVWRRIFLQQILLDYFPQSSTHVMDLVEAKFEEEYKILQTKNLIEEEDACSELVTKLEKYWSEQNLYCSKNYFIHYLELIYWSPEEGVYFLIPQKSGLLIEETYLQYQFVLRRVLCGRPLVVHFVTKEQQHFAQQDKFSLWYTLLLYLKSPSSEGLNDAFSKVIANCQQMISSKSVPVDHIRNYYQQLFQFDSNICSALNRYAQEWLYPYDRLIQWMLVISNHCRAVRSEDHIELVQHLFELVSLKKQGIHVQSYYGVDSAFHTTKYSASQYGILCNELVKMIPVTTFSAFGNRFTIHYPINVQQFNSKYNFKQIFDYQREQTSQMRNILYSSTLNSDDFTLELFCQSISQFDQKNLNNLVSSSANCKQWKELIDKLASSKHSVFKCNLHSLHQIIICPTSIGRVYQLQDETNGDVMDLTDYESW